MCSPAALCSTPAQSPAKPALVVYHGWPPASSTRLEASEVRAYVPQRTNDTLAY